MDKDNQQYYQQKHHQEETGGVTALINDDYEGNGFELNELRKRKGKFISSAKETIENGESMKIYTANF